MGQIAVLKLIVIATLIVCSVAHAQILIWWNYSEWERQPQDPKVAYLAGAFDSLVGLADIKRKFKWLCTTASAFLMLI
jgi:hypothetical protein